MHAVYSPGVLLLSQIVCADASQEGSASPATAAASALNDAWGLLQQHKEEAGLAACTAWSCRIFVTPEISRCLRSGMNVSRCCSSGPALREGGVATGLHADSSVPTTEGLSGAAVCEVVGLHDGEAAVAWALRVVVAQ